MKQTKTGRPRKSPLKRKIPVGLRIDLQVKASFEKFAEEDRLEVADMYRIALREYMDKRQKAA